MNQEDIKSMRVALDNMDDYAKMECSIDPIGAYKVLSAGIDMLESLSNQLTDCQRGRDEHNNFMQRNNQVVALYDNPAPSVPEWQPIETAPKDGTVVLLAGCRKPVAAAWLEDEIDYWHVDDNKLGPFVLRGPGPTHWMPLPKPPSARSK